jgi:hypothetical protein
MTRRWRDLGPGERRAIMVGGAVQLVLLSAALADLRRRAPDEVRGGKRLWVPAVFVNLIGPIAYFLLGRKR